MGRISDSSVMWNDPLTGWNNVGVRVVSASRKPSVSFIASYIARDLFFNHSLMCGIKSSPKHSALLKLSSTARGKGLID
jgi:hypothetical protein